MSLKLYNTLTRKKETFTPLKGTKVGLYSCGPTVYWYQHIGNLRTYVFVDILKRVLQYEGYTVNHVMNVTDVGHLTSDADEGDDKMEKAAKKEGKTAQEIADYYLSVFEKDLEKLNINPASVMPKATEHVAEQIAMIVDLEKKGFVYKTGDGIYFDTSKFKEYGKLARLKKEGLHAGKRVKIGEKKNPTDFALWKFSEKKGKRQQEWDSPWGVGFPGWHIECSAMSSKYLGKQFDIHTGGADHIPIHHTNEIAQSEASFGKKPWVRYWLHAAFLTFKGEKVSKSEGGLYTITELEKKGYDPLDYRYLCLTAHYRTQLSFSLANLDNAKTSLKRLRTIVRGLEDDGTMNTSYMKAFENAIGDDLNMPRALETVWECVRDLKAKGKVGTLAKMDSILGLDVFAQEAVVTIPKDVQDLVEEREKARKEKEWKRADTLRDQISAKGYSIEDSVEGVVVKKR